MSNARPSNIEDDRITLGLLNLVERNGERSQRHLASELGIALGLVNAYLRRCVKKGLVKVGQAPARRYVYFLTPKGFAEKSRLTIEYISVSFSFFRQARADCVTVLAAAEARGWKRVVLVGISDLAEIIRVCALDSGIEIVAIVDPYASVAVYVGLPVESSFAAIAAPWDGLIVTDLRSSREAFASARDRFGAGCVLAPALLGLETPSAEEPGR